MISRYSLVLAFSAQAACTTVTQRSLRPAVATPGTVGFGISTRTESSLGRTESDQFTGTAAALAPGISAVARDVVWHVDHAQKLVLCRPRVDGSHACVPVSDAGSGVVIVDPTNRGNYNTQVSAYVGAGVTVTAINTMGTLASSRGLALSPHYGIWVSDYGLMGLKLCRIRRNLPECVDAKRDDKSIVSGRVLSVQILRDGDRMRDVAWIDTHKRITRCEAGPEGPARCADAKLD